MYVQNPQLHRVKLNRWCFFWLGSVNGLYFYPEWHWWSNYRKWNSIWNNDEDIMERIRRYEYPEHVVQARRSHVPYIGWNFELFIRHIWYFNKLSKNELISRLFRVNYFLSSFWKLCRRKCFGKRITTCQRSRRVTCGILFFIVNGNIWTFK